MVRPPDGPPPDGRTPRPRNQTPRGLPQGSSPGSAFDAQGGRPAALAPRAAASDFSGPKSALRGPETRSARWTPARSRPADPEGAETCPSLCRPSGSLVVWFLTLPSPPVKHDDKEGSALKGERGKGSGGGRERDAERASRERRRERKALARGAWATNPLARSRPLVAGLGAQGQLSREVGRPDPRQPWARRPPPSWTVMLSPRGQAGLEDSPILLSPWARRRDFWALPHRPLLPARPGPGGWVVRMYSIILFWKLDASSFLILYKEETNKVCFCVYCLFIVR